MRVHRATTRLLLALATCAVAFVAACGSSDDSGGGSSGQTGKDAAGTLTIWHYYDEGAGGLYPKLKVWKRDFESAHPKVKVNFQYVPYDQMTAKVIAAAAAGKGPDLIMPASPFLPEMIKAGAVEPVDAYWDKYADKDLFPARILDTLKFQGKRYAVQAFANVEGLYYNDKILKRIGAEPPGTVEDLEAAMQKAQAAGFKGLTLSAPTGAGGEFGLVPWLASAGWSYQDPKNAAAGPVLDRLAAWRDKGYISKSDASGFVGATNFTTGKYAFAVEGNWNLGTFRKSLKFKYGVAVPQGLDKAAIGGEGFAIGANAKNKDLAWQMIQEVFLSKRGALEAADAGSIPLRTDVVKEPEIADDPYLSPFAKIAGASVGIPLLKDSGKVSDVLGGTFNQLIAGKIDGAQADQKITQDLPPLIAES